MNSVSVSLRAFGLYMMLVPGIGLMSMPDVMLDLFGLGHGEHLWTARVVGLLAFIIGTYQYFIAKRQIDAMYLLTAWQRYFAAMFFVSLWVTGEAAAAILLFALIDFAGATWTLFASQRSKSV